MRHRTPTRDTRNARRGTALVVILLSVLMLAAVVMTALVGTSASVALSRGALSRAQSLYAAESAASYALWEFTYGEGKWAAWRPLPDGGKRRTGKLTDEDGTVLASYTVTVSDPSQSVTTVTAVASRQTGYDTTTVQRDVEVQLAKAGGGGGGWFQYGVFGTNSVSVKNLAMVDSYDSSQGSYLATRDSEAQVAVNSNMPGAIEAVNWGIIKGDAYIGYEGDPETGIEGRVTGERGALAEPNVPPSVEAPTDITHDIGKVDLKNDEKLLIDQDTVCDSLDLKNDAVLQVSGNVRLYVRGNLDMKNFVRIKIPPGSSLTVYAGGRVTIKNAAVINWQTQKPEQCIIYGLDTCDKVEIKNIAIAYAAVYAPKAKFIAKNLCGFYGAMVAQEADIKNLAAFHHDKAVGQLAPESLPAGGGRSVKKGDAGDWNISAWRITR
jgi:Tfp pilus assembly protein PilX